MGPPVQRSRTPSPQGPDVIFFQNKITLRNTTLRKITLRKIDQCLFSVVESDGRYANDFHIHQT